MKSASAPLLEPFFGTLSPRSLQDELAGRIADTNNYHNTVLISIFHQTMAELAQGGCTFSPAVQERVWNHIRPMPLSALKTVLIQEIRAKLLSGLGDDELRVMLAEHEVMGQILQTHLTFYANVQRMTDSIYARVHAEGLMMMPRLKRCLIDAVHEELTNILFPDQQ